jgi:putative MATE family efflux protein
MHDLTQGSIPRHLFRLAGPMALGMVFQMAYYLVDLFFVGRLGDTALAGVSAAGNLQFIVMAVTQVLGVGTMVLIAHAVGRKDQPDANLVFNQSLALAAIAGASVLLLGYTVGARYVAGLAADAATAKAGAEYMYAFLPAMALQFALVSFGAALRGTGIAKPTMVVQFATVVINAALAPVLIAGWGTGLPLGVAGAGLASSIAVGAGVVMLWMYFVRLEHYVGFDRAMLKPRLETWTRMLRIGVPAGGEFALMFVSMAVIYFLIADFGAAAQAGFGVGQRVMQALFLPVMAIAMSVGPIAGQNMGAKQFARVRESFWHAIKIGSALMLVVTIIARAQPEWLVQWFSEDGAVIATAAEFLSMISLNFVASGIVFTCSGIFQAFGNTVPSIVSSATRLTIFVIPAFIISQRPGFQLRHLWMVSITATTVHALFALWLLRREAFRKGLLPA